MSFFQDLKNAIQLNDVENVWSILQQEKWLVNWFISIDQRCCLCEAIAQGFDDIAKVLIEAGADVNLHCVDGLTPLITAVECGNSGMIDLLLQQPHIDVTLASLDLSPLQIATRRGDDHIARQLLNANANIDSFVEKRNGQTRRERHKVKIIFFGKKRLFQLLCFRLYTKLLGTMTSNVFARC